jgi:hypothetical protein
VTGRGGGSPLCGPFWLVDLSMHVNCVGIEPANRPGTGGFNIWGNTYPAEQLPPPGTIVGTADVPFLFGADRPGSPDNVRCRGQRVALPTTCADWLYILGAAERRTEDVAVVHYQDGSRRRQWLRLSDFWPETPSWFSEPVAFRTASMLYPKHEQQSMFPAIWCQRMPLAIPGGLAGITLPDNPAMHIFAMTLLDEEAATPCG